MALFNVFVPGLETPVDPTKITGGQPSPSPATDAPQRVGMLVQGVNAASAAAAAAAVQAALPSANQQALMHVYAQGSDVTA